MDTIVGRKRELALLDQLGNSKKAEFLVVYGRRRVGKSKLLTYWASKQQKTFLYWVASQTTHTDSLRSFSKTLFEFMNPTEHTSDEFSYFSWETALREAAKFAQQTPFILILDEFTYALEGSPELASILQNTWDQYFKPANLFLIISGSQVHMMMKAVHSYQAPLYGRATARMHLHPLRYQGVGEFFPQYPADELIATQAVIGGIPAYLEKFDPAQNFSQNLREAILKPATLMQSDAVLLLHEQFDEPATYAAVLKAIAYNKRTPREIIAFTNLQQSHMSRYLSTLTNLGIVQRHVPLPDIDKVTSRKGRYYLHDPYLRFYFRFIEPLQNRLELGQTEAILQEIKANLRAFIGEHTFELLCQDWVGIVSDQGKIPLLVDRIGSYWGSDTQMDVMATVTSKKQVLLGECKWGLQPIEVEVIEKLARQAPKVVSHLPDSAKWKTYLYLFTRTELTPEAATRAKELQVEIISLERLDHDLRQEV